jgi:hypothetical protein
MEMANRLWERLFFKKYKKKIVLYLFGRSQHGHKIVFLFDSLACGEMEWHLYGGKLLSPLAPSPIQDLSAALRAHSSPEAMIFLPFLVIGLKRSLHKSAPSLFDV